ncbi:MAG: hypothetical protein V2I31_00900 [Mariniphaga sp.]|nr:hypothetical protein [Mariniphaga sp.]
MFVAFIIVGFGLLCSFNSPGQEINSIKEKLSNTEFKFDEASGISFEEGVMSRDADDVIKEDDNYYVYCTKVYGRAPKYWGTIWAAVLEDEGYSFKEVDEVFRTRKKGDWGSRAVFTPNILEENATFYLYYTAFQPTLSNNEGECENNLVNDYTGIGVEKADNSLGSYIGFIENPNLTVSENHDLVDSYRLDDAVVLQNDGKFRLYYNGQKYTDGDSGAMHNKMGVAFSDSKDLLKNIMKIQYWIKTTKFFSGDKIMEKHVWRRLKVHIVKYKRIEF